MKFIQIEDVVLSAEHIVAVTEHIAKTIFLLMNTKAKLMGLMFSLLCAAKRVILSLKQKL